MYSKNLQLTSFWGFVPFLTMKGLYMHTKYGLYETCLRSEAVYGSETWSVKDDNANN